MNSLTPLDRPTRSLDASRLLARDGFICTLFALEPDAEATLPATPSRDDQLLFVVEGAVAVHREGVTTLVNQGEAHLLRAGVPPSLTGRSNGPTRLLRVEIPPRQVVTPQIIKPRA